jgi:sec-independent protein translocase protein TatC
MWGIREYYSFVTHICLAIGLVCELPVVMVTLNAMGMMPAAWLRGMRIYGYAISLVIAGIVSPTPDPIMLMLFAAPIMGLFEACIWLVHFLEKRREAKEKLAEARASMDPNEPID